MPALQSGKHDTKFAGFYPRYIALHQNHLNRRCHLLGLALALASLVAFLVSGKLPFLIAAPIVGYGLSWLGHYWFEGNQPATKENPLWSFVGSLTMARDVLLGRLSL
jgi:hypothetical protein